MKLWLIVPVKPLDEAKSRLAPILSSAERAALMAGVLDHVLACAQAAETLAGIIVISRDQAIRKRAQAFGAIALHEAGHELNSALDQARQFALAQRADAILVLPADLPLLTVEDLRHLHHLAATGRGLVIAPSRGGGTSALLLRPPHAIPFAFGPASFAQHCRLAAEHGYGCVVYESPTLAFDVDTPADWAELQQTR